MAIRVFPLDAFCLFVCCLSLTCFFKISAARREPSVHSSQPVKPFLFEDGVVRVDNHFIDIQESGLSQVQPVHFGSTAIR